MRIVFTLTVTPACVWTIVTPNFKIIVPLNIISALQNLCAFVHMCMCACVAHVYSRPMASTRRCVELDGFNCYEDDKEDSWLGSSELQDKWGDISVGVDPVGLLSRDEPAFEGSPSLNDSSMLSRGCPESKRTRVSLSWW